MSTYDIGLYDGAKALYRLSPCQAATGAVKICQKFSSAFMTELGTVTYDPGYGSSFLIWLRNGAIRTDLDVVSYFNQSVSEVLNYLRSYETESTPDDERINTVVLDHFELNPPVLLLYVVLTTAAGNSVSIQLPVTSLQV
jgi:hypothetical protein